MEAVEFIRRFLLHVLPSGFGHIRHFGFLANRKRKEKLALCRSLLPAPQIVIEASADSPGIRWQLTAAGSRGHPEGDKMELLNDQLVEFATVLVQELAYTEGNSHDRALPGSSHWRRARLAAVI